MHDDLPGGFTDRVQQYSQQCHVVLHRSIDPFRTSFSGVPGCSPRNDLKNVRAGGNQPPGGDRVHPGSDMDEFGPGPGVVPLA